MVEKPKKKHAVAGRTKKKEIAGHKKRLTLPQIEVVEHAYAEASRENPYLVAIGFSELTPTSNINRTAPHKVLANLKSGKADSDKWNTGRADSGSGSCFSGLYLFALSALVFSGFRARGGHRVFRAYANFQHQSHCSP